MLMDSKSHFMKILFVTSAHNGLSQRAYLELSERGHQIEIHVMASHDALEARVQEYKPELIIAPFLKVSVPESIWKKIPVFIVHPGIKGDRGPSSLDWAIMNNYEEWGVTILQAAEEMDAGDIWASHNFKMREVSKSNLYRHEVTQAAIKGLLEAVAKFESKAFNPEPLDYDNANVKGKLHNAIKTQDREIDWNDSTDCVIRKINAADSTPGVLDEICGEKFRLFGAHREGLLTGNPGEIIAKRDGAICRATRDGAVWITHLKRHPHGIKLPATLVLNQDLVENLPDVSLRPSDHYHGLATFREIWYEERENVGYLHFDFYNGAMSTNQCKRLQQALIEAKQKNTNVIVLMGGHDIWSNGIHLNVIENAEDPAQESWENINAMNDLVYEIMITDTHYVIAAMQGNAGAGGAILALAADRVYARNGVVLNPHYKRMGGLYGSEYWTYLLPRRVGLQKALEIIEKCEPLGTTSAKEIGFIDDCFEDDIAGFKRTVHQKATTIASDSNFKQLLVAKINTRRAEESVKPLADYRREELDHMWDNFFGSSRAYHVARFQFVYKISCKMPPQKKMAERVRVKMFIHFSKGVRRSARILRQFNFGWLIKFFLS
jgi:putative two-component system protein, hydrogenase maturation factor HypX/HoxX